MAIKPKAEFLPEHSLSEREVGNAQSQITYPKMIDCVCVTGFSTAGLLGTHISPGEDEEELKETLRLLNMGGGKACSAWYIVGNFTKHESNVKVNWWGTPQKMAKALRSSIDKRAVVKVCDTTPLYAAGGYGLGFDIIATHGIAGVSFAHRLSGRKNKDTPASPVEGPFLKA